MNELKTLQSRNTHQNGFVNSNYKVTDKIVLKNNNINKHF